MRNLSAFPAASLRARLLLLALIVCGSAAAAAAQAPDDRIAIPQLGPTAPISAEEYARRRAALVARMEDGVLVSFGAAEADRDYLPYAQYPSFRYLTGIVEPGAGLIIEKRGGDVRETLFVRRRDPARELWEGARLGIEGATRLTGIPARVSEEFVPTLNEATQSHSTVYTMGPAGPPPSGATVRTAEQQVVSAALAASPGTRWTTLDDALDRLRATKSPAEQELIRRAVVISALAHREAMRSLAPGMNEFEIQGLVEYQFRRNGAERPAYSSIVGSGPNATTLHYRAADRFMRPGELLLMDVGAAYLGYAADITRTMPVDGRFSPEQRAIYEIVLEAQKAAEQLVRVGPS